ncbi:uncharacterized protein LOC106640002 [Copidosoma floridanum]|uniref:uncharacterized protein LOC106640002 n=1 Tax=Copidosoma floridanum TaxID=29053 RepID=UPI0006C966DC|nr:uncharacterized protein LOC106640002 [Copidosoma floridanum]
MVWEGLPPKRCGTAADKATRVSGALLQLMPNAGGPWKAKRRLLASVSNWILLYSAEVWVDVIARRYIWERLISIQRIGLLRIVGAYHTVSSTAIMVIARTISIVLLALEQRWKFLGSGDESNSNRWEKTLTTWKQEWD